MELAQPVPEFPFAIQILIVGIVSILIFSRKFDCR
ncbi:MAG: PEFG-CTERM sorting domain-containing protein [Thaumarchaeota archaeon]|nr:PEFG-CTERM sorting domain-containing protein [Nitrososphaerota archaeon]